MDYEKLFEDDLTEIVNIDEDEDEDDFLMKSIAQFKMQLIESNTIEMRINNNIDGWTDLMDSSLAVENAFVVDMPATFPKVGFDDEAERNFIVHLTERDYKFIDEIIRLPEVEDLLFEIVQAIEYTQSFSQGVVNEMVTNIELSHITSSVNTNIHMFDENSIPNQDVVVDDSNSSQLYDDIINNNNSFRDNFKKALESIEVIMIKKEEEYKRSIEQARIEREERYERRRQEQGRIRRDIMSIRIQSVYRGHATRMETLKIKEMLRKQHENEKQLYELQIQKELEMRTRQKELQEVDMMRAEEMSGRSVWTKTRSYINQNLNAMSVEDWCGQALRKDYQMQEWAKRCLMFEDMTSLKCNIEWRREMEIQLEAMRRKEAEMREELERKEIERKEIERKELERKEIERKAKMLKEEFTLKNRDVNSHRDLSETTASKSSREEKGSANQSEGNKNKSKIVDSKTSVIPPAVRSSGWGGVVPTHAIEEERVNKQGFVSTESNVVGIISVSSQSTSSSSTRSCLVDISSSGVSASTSSSALAIHSTKDDRYHLFHTLVTNAIDVTSTSLKLEDEYSFESEINSIFTELSSEVASVTSTLHVSNILFHCLKTWQQSNFVTHLKQYEINAMHNSSQSDNENSACESLKLSVEGLSDLSFLKDPKKSNINILDLNVNKISNIDIFQSLPLVSSLTSLNLKDNMLTSVQGLCKCVALIHLFLDSNKIRNLDGVENLPFLVHLSASTNHISSLPKLNCKYMQKLELYHNRIESLPSHVFESLVSLTHLDLGRNKLCHISGHILSQCPLLSQLVLSQNQLTEVPYPLYLPNLKSLWLSGNKLTNIDTWIGATSPSVDTWPTFLPMLDKIYLQDNLLENISDLSLITSPYLSEIDLSFNKLASTDKIIGLSSCTFLKIIKLQDNPLTNVNITSETKLSIEKWIRRFASQIQEISGELVDVINMNSSSPHSNYHNLTQNNTNSSFTNRLKSKIELHRLYKDSEQNDVLLHLLGSFLHEQSIYRVGEKAMQAGSGQVKLTYTDIQRNHILKLLYFNCDDISSLEHTIYMGDRKNNIQPLSSADIPYKYDHSTAITMTRQQYHQKKDIDATKVIQIQKLWRGYVIRQKLHHILNFSKYKDDELDDLLMEGNENPLSDLYWKDIPELEDKWLLDGVTTSGNAPLVYGDHKRRNTKHECEEESSQSSRGLFTPYTPEAKPSTSRFRRDEFKVDMPSYGSIYGHDNDHNDNGGVEGGVKLPSISRPASQSSSVSGSSRGGGMHSARSNNASNIASEWGVEDAQLLETMLKRNKKIRRYEEVKEKRELEKDASYRYEKFLHSASAGNNTNTKNSGSFGGKPKTFRNAGNTKKGKSVPAWLLGSDIDTDEHKDR